MLPIIEAHNIGKKFRIFHKDMPYLSLRDNIVSYIKNPVRLFQNHTEEFWALKDVSFEVMPGESVGIIGKNGAGKSTLLKILSRITPPTTGKITLRGRVASLLEVGTGFHPELTGRENVFFNGAILGMKRSEIKQKFDEIVAFAGVEKFIDTPLKHYSSGMQLRLAFAVAAFLEAEILVVDEVLAVGDAEFQKKCLGKMEDVTKREGRTVLFVSHNMGTIMGLCNKGIFLRQGKISFAGNIYETTRKYLDSLYSGTPAPLNSKWIRKVELFSNGIQTESIISGNSLELIVHINHSKVLTSPVIGIIIKDIQNNYILGVNNRNYGIRLSDFQEGKVLIRIPTLPLYEGTYHIDIRLGENFRDIEIVENIIKFEVTLWDTDSHIITEKPYKDLNKLLIRGIDFKVLT